VLAVFEMWRPKYTCHPGIRRPVFVGYTVHC